MEKVTYTVRTASDVRECVLDDEHYVHILHSGHRMHKDDPRIIEVKDTRVAAIRGNERVGKGSCTSIDECYSDAELAAALDEEGIVLQSAAVKWAIELEGLRIEDATNKRWGEDSDPELKRLREWEAQD